MGFLCTGVISDGESNSEVGIFDFLKKCPFFQKVGKMALFAVCGNLRQSGIQINLESTSIWNPDQINLESRSDFIELLCYLQRENLEFF